MDWLRSAAKTRKRRRRASGTLSVTLISSTCRFTLLSVTREYVLVFRQSWTLGIDPASLLEVGPFYFAPGS